MGRDGPQLGAPFGFLLANGVYLALMLGMDFNKNESPLDHAFYQWGWRIPFLASAIMVIIGLYVRLRLAETPVFKAVVDAGERPDPAGHRDAHRVATDGVGHLHHAGDVHPLLSDDGMGQLVRHQEIDRRTGDQPRDRATTFIKMQLIAVLFFAVCIPVSGLLADRLGRKPVLIAVTVAIIIFGISFSLFIGPDVADQTRMLWFLIVGMTLMGLTFGPMSAVLPELVRDEHPVHRFGHLVQHGVHPRCRRRPVHRDRIGVEPRCRRRRRLPGCRRGHHPGGADPRARDPRHQAHRDLTKQATRRSRGQNLLVIQNPSLAMGYGVRQTLGCWAVSSREATLALVAPQISRGVPETNQQGRTNSSVGPRGCTLMRGDSAFGRYSPPPLVFSFVGR